MPLAGVYGAEPTLDNALSELSEFSLERPRALPLFQTVARTGDQWPRNIAQQGVATAGTEQLNASRDRDALAPHYKPKKCEVNLGRMKGIDSTLFARKAKILRLQFTCS